MPVHTVGLTYKTDSGSVPLSGVAYVVDDEINGLYKVAAGAVNTQYAISFPFANVTAFCLSVATQSATQATSGARSEAAAGTIVAKFNSSSTPVPSITVVAKAPIAFAAAIPGTTNLFTANVTTVYLSNAGAADLWLEVHVALAL